MKYFICPHCGKQLENHATWIYEEIQNGYEFWCDDCGKIYILEEDGSCIVEESI